MIYFDYLNIADFVIISKADENIEEAVKLYRLSAEEGNADAIRNRNCVGRKIFPE